MKKMRSMFIVQDECIVSDAISNTTNIVKPTIFSHQIIKHDVHLWFETFQVLS